MPPDADRRFMAVAGRLAMRHVGRTAENPSVGCLIVAAGRIVGRGVTASGGRPHAERLALDEAGVAARGATAYVTLEPCAHHGQTPPCADALVASGVARVVIGAADPDPRVDGRGIAILERAGIVTNRLENVDSRAIEGFLSRVARGRPHLTLKLALSADGFIGRAGEGPVAITGAIANRQTHLCRARSDLVMIGIGTAEADDPQLTVRLDGLHQRSPARLVVDPSLRLPLDGALVRSARTVPLLVATQVAATDPRTEALREDGAIAVPLGSDDRALHELLRDLANRGFSSVFCEGGAGLAASLLAADLVDRLILIRSMQTIGEPGIAVADLDSYLPRFTQGAVLRFGQDRWHEYHGRTG